MRLISQDMYNEGWVPTCNPVGQCICVFNRSVFLQVFDARVSVWCQCQQRHRRCWEGALEGIARPQHFVMPLQMKLYELFLARTICKAYQSQSYSCTCCQDVMRFKGSYVPYDTMGHSCTVSAAGFCIIAEPHVVELSAWRVKTVA
jgi:hypothetical protein